MKTTFTYTNCLFEAVAAKIKLGKQVELIHINAKQNEVFCPHWMWHDLIDNNVYDFHPICEQKGLFDLLFARGTIRVRPYAVYERWLRTKSW